MGPPANARTVLSGSTSPRRAPHAGVDPSSAICHPPPARAIDTQLAVALDRSTGDRNVQVDARRLHCHELRVSRQQRRPRSGPSMRTVDAEKLAAGVDSALQVPARQQGIRGEKTPPAQDARTQAALRPDARYAMPATTSLAESRPSACTLSIIAMDAQRSPPREVQERARSGGSTPPDIPSPHLTPPHTCTTPRIPLFRAFMTNSRAPCEPRRARGATSENGEAVGSGEGTWGTIDGKGSRREEGRADTALTSHPMEAGDLGKLRPDARSGDDAEAPHRGTCAGSSAILHPRTRPALCKTMQTIGRGCMAHLIRTLHRPPTVARAARPQEPDAKDFARRRARDRGELRPDAPHVGPCSLHHREPRGSNRRHVKAVEHARWRIGRREEQAGRNCSRECRRERGGAATDTWGILAHSSQDAAGCGIRGCRPVRVTDGRTRSRGAGFWVLGACGVERVVQARRQRWRGNLGAGKRGCTEPVLTAANDGAAGAAGNRSPGQVNGHRRRLARTEGVSKAAHVGGDGGERQQKAQAGRVRETTWNKEECISVRVHVVASSRVYAGIWRTQNESLMHDEVNWLCRVVVQKHEGRADVKEHAASVCQRRWMVRLSATGGCCTPKEGDRESTRRCDIDWASELRVGAFGAAGKDGE
ncbi:hypothetical protein DFH06DRAFT_1418553 [Mycena polygramma]|nr:hypothetical protein DFH06DRAFT_1418553 [Mycena polygramma]